jgi:Tfp pilus assembly protein PilF
VPIRKDADDHQGHPYEEHRNVGRGPVPLREKQYKGREGASALPEKGGKVSKRNLLIIGVIAVLVVGAALGVYLFTRQGKPAKKVAETTLKEGEKNFSKGAFKDALADLKKAVSENPDSFKAHFLLAKSYEALGQLDNAFVEYQKAAKLDPKNAEVHYNLALLYKEKGDAKKAISELEESIRIFPNFVGARNLLAKYYGEQGETDEAVEQYKKIIELKPFGFDLAGVHNELGLLYINQGRRQDAIKEWQAALSIDPNNQRAKDLLAQYR